MSIEEQLELEKRMVGYGVVRYHSQVSDAIKYNREGDTAYSQRLLGSLIEPVAQAIKDFCAVKSTGKSAKYRALLRKVEPHTAAYIGLRALLNHLSKQESVASLAIHVGTALEDDLKFKVFGKEHPQYYDKIIEDFRNRGTTNYRYMHRVLTYKANEKELEWASWSTSEKAAVGLKLVDLVIKETGLVDKKLVKGNNHVQAIIVPSSTTKEWLDSFNKFAAMLDPDRLPCVIEPDEWISNEQGGYYSPQMRKRTPMVKTRSSKQRELLEVGTERIMEAVNRIQRVQWKVNTDVLDIMQQAWDMALPIGFPRSNPYDFPKCPIPESVKPKSLKGEAKDEFEEWKSEMRILHIKENERVSKAYAASRGLKIAQEFRDKDRFWFVWQCDFRGRLYCSSNGMNPQGPDFVKALLQFANPEPLTESGVYWLKVHGANTFGVDKVSFDERVQWVNDNEKYILATAADALSNKGFWSGADDPWQFLAFCFEYARYKRDGLGCATYLPVSMDGSCNGLQNFSAMLRDEVGGAATNLVPTNKPSDIYAIVAQRTTDKLVGVEGEEAALWNEYIRKHTGGSLPRSLTKRPVMTLPYGATRQSCSQYICQWIMEDTTGFFNNARKFKLATWLTPYVWAAINETVIAARGAMSWLQTVAGEVTKIQKPLVWWSPLGFPVYMDRKKRKSKQIHTELMGHFRLRINEDTDILDSNKQRLGVSPNFVHSMDACHLMYILLNMDEYGINDIAAVHDSFGTHASKVEDMHKLIRDAFVMMYETHDPLTSLKHMIEHAYEIKLPRVPDTGSLNLQEVKLSKYFFA